MDSYLSPFWIIYAGCRLRLSCILALHLLYLLLRLASRMAIALDVSRPVAAERLVTDSALAIRAAYLPLFPSLLSLGDNGLRMRNMTVYRLSAGALA